MLVWSCLLSSYNPVGTNWIKLMSCSWLIPAWSTHMILLLQYQFDKDACDLAFAMLSTWFPFDQYRHIHELIWFKFLSIWLALIHAEYDLCLGCMFYSSHLIFIWSSNDTHKWIHAECLIYTNPYDMCTGCMFYVLTRFVLIYVVLYVLDMFYTPLVELHWCLCTFAILLWSMPFHFSYHDICPCLHLYHDQCYFAMLIWTSFSINILQKLN